MTLTAFTCLARSAPEAIYQATSQKDVARQVGVIKSTSGNTIVLTTDDGGTVTIDVPGNTKIVRVAPGQTDLKVATAIHLNDLTTGDRILVRGESSAPGSFVAIGIIAMKGADVTAKRQQDQEDWQKRGIGGLVNVVDLSAGTIKISVPGMAGAGPVVIHTTKSTVLRRYAPGSVMFDDAKLAPLDEIKVGDQLRARGTRSPDGSEFTADEVVSGTFRNIAGTISSIDPNAKTLNVKDAIAKRSVLVQITDQSQLRKMPPEVAQRMAMRLKRATVAVQSTGQAGTPGVNAVEEARNGSPDSTNATNNQRPQLSGGMRRAQDDFQQVVNRVPAAGISDFHKDDAVMIVSTAGKTPGEVTAIMLLGGVEPILAAAPSGSQAINLSPWGLGASAPAGAEAGP